MPPKKVKKRRATLILCVQKRYHRHSLGEALHDCQNVHGELGWQAFAIPDTASFFFLEQSTGVFLSISEVE